jgi:hypothetical protein
VILSERPTKVLTACSSGTRKRFDIQPTSKFRFAGEPDSWRVTVNYEL